MQINWQQFGLKTNPYDTSALVEGGELSLTEAFIGRNDEKAYLDGLLESDERLCLTICGETGVGKTSFANVEKHTWKFSKPKLLFSCRREIEASDTLLDKQNFILEVIGSILREIKLLNSDLLQNPVLQQIQQIIDFTQTIAISSGVSVSASFAGIGGGLEVGRDTRSTTPMKISMSSLEQHFQELLTFIKTHKIGDYQYSGILVHVNNFDVVLGDGSRDQKVIQFFNEIRDFLSTKDVYFLFLGPSDFYRRIIAKEQRVKSIFARTPLLVNPLSKTEVVEAFEKRMALLKSEGVQKYIIPVDNDVIFRLYDLYEGDIRSIMTAIKDLLSQCSERILQPLTTDEALLLLGRERWSKIEKTQKLTKVKTKILEVLIRADEPMIAAQIAEITGKQESNISFYLKSLKESGIIEEDKDGIRKNLKLSKEYEPLKWWLAAETAVKKEEKVAEVKAMQMNLFDKVSHSQIS